MATTIIYLIVIFAFTIWPVKKVARWCGAQNDSYGAVIFAIFLSVIFFIGAFILSIPLAAMGTVTGFILIVVIFVFAIGKAYSKALETPFWNGLAIAIFSVIFSYVLMFLLYLLLFGVGVSVYGASMLFGQFASEPESQMSDFEYNQDVETGEETYTVESPESAEPLYELETEQHIPVSTDNVDEEEPPEPKILYTWRTATVQELPDLINKNLKIVTTRDKNRNGILKSFQNGELVVEKSRGVLYQVHVKKVKSIQVYDVQQ